MERVAENVVLGAAVEELVHAFLGVRRVCIAHCGAGVAQAPLRRESGTPRQPRVAARYISQRLTGDEVVIQITMVGYEITIVTVVVIQLLAHVEGAISQRVIEEAERDLVGLLIRQVERDVLVERIGRTCAVAHGVYVAHAVALPHAVGFPCPLAQAEVQLVGLALEVVIDLLIPQPKL